MPSNFYPGEQVMMIGYLVRGDMPGMARDDRKKPQPATAFMDFAGVLQDIRELRAR